MTARRNLDLILLESSNPDTRTRRSAFAGRAHISTLQPIADHAFIDRTNYGVLYTGSTGGCGPRAAGPSLARHFFRRRNTRRASLDLGRYGADPRGCVDVGSPNLAPGLKQYRTVNVARA